MADTLIRATHPYGFRSGQWATIVSCFVNIYGRACFKVRFPDGIEDDWAVNDPDDAYEFTNRIDVFAGQGKAEPK